MGSLPCNCLGDFRPLSPVADLSVQCQLGSETLLASTTPAIPVQPETRVVIHVGPDDDSLSVKPQSELPTATVAAVTTAVAPSRPATGFKLSKNINLNSIDFFSGGGGESFNSWIGRLERILAIAGDITDQERLTFLAAKLTGQAESFYLALDPLTQQDYQSLKKAFQNEFLNGTP